MEFKYVGDETFKQVDFSRRVERGEFENCRFVRCVFLETNLQECRFVDCEFESCDLSNAQLVQTSFQDVRFKECKMQGLMFSDCNEFGFEVGFDDCRLDYSVFQQMNLKRMSVRHCSLKGVDFSQAALQDAVLRDCDLKHATFEQTDLQRADLSGSHNYVIDPERNRLKGARFSIPEVVGLLQKYGIKLSDDID